MIYFAVNRNYRQTCQQLSGLDLAAWKSDEEPEYSTEAIDTDEEPITSIEEISESMIKAAVEKAKIDLNERNRFEYMSWLNRKLLKIINQKKEVFSIICYQQFFEGGGVDARTPDGTAASFSKANRNALRLANSSLFYEFASNEILNSLSKYESPHIPRSNVKTKSN